LKFAYDAAVDCELSVFLATHATEDKTAFTTIDLQAGFGETVSIAIPTTQLPQHLQSNLASNYSAFLLTASPKQPVSAAQTSASTSLTSAPPQPPQAHSSGSTADPALGADIDLYSNICSVTLTSSDQTDLIVRVDKATVRSNSVTYVLSEIFGVPSHTNDDTSGNTRECVVCLSEPATTFPLPCRHCCLCMNCADLFRQQSNKCPICRAPLRALIQVVPKVHRKFDS